jgi:hypothetical protein
VESGSGTVLDLTHHAYPFGVRSEVTIADPASPLFADRETIVHYPGWTFTRNSGIAQGVFGFYGFAFAEERDATSSQRTSYCEVSASTEEGDPVQLDLRAQIPETFSGWGADGIVLRHRIFIGAGAGSALDTGSVTLEVYDPTTASDTVAVTVTRSKGANVADDTGYVDLQFTKAALDGMSNPFGAGDMLHLRIELFGLFGLGVHQPTFRCGRLSAHFEGPTFLA